MCRIPAPTTAASAPSATCPSSSCTYSVVVSLHTSAPGSSCTCLTPASGRRWLAASRKQEAVAHLLAARVADVDEQVEASRLDLPAAAELWCLQPAVRGGLVEGLLEHAVEVV